MYIPKHFEVNDEQTTFNFIEAYSFGVIVAGCEGVLNANHVPFLLDKQSKRLYGHFSKANSQWKELEQSQDVLVIFSGPNAYISPSWYESTGLPPTWNFSSVHVNGKARLVDESKTSWIVHHLTKTHEAQFTTPWDTQNMSDHELQEMFKAIVGFEIGIITIQAKFKLSQNRKKTDIKGAIRGLKSQQDAQSELTARVMEQQQGSIE